MKKTHILFFTIILGLACVAVFPQNAGAYVVEELNFQNEGDIVVGPGKTELQLSPGDISTHELLISNRSGMDKIFSISVEDFQGSEDPGATVKFMGGEKGPYSLKDYVKPEVEEIILSHGQRLRLPVVVSIPETAEPGGLYGAVMISASNIDEGPGDVEADKAAGKMKVITRIASLFFVRVKGDIIEAGALQDFTTAKNFYEKGPVVFKILSENTGNVHLSPYGGIDIKNILGANVGEINVDPWFVMPSSERTREIKWNSNFLFGRYTAVVTLNRGYNDIVDTKEFSFWVIPWKLVLIATIGLILILWLLIFLATHLEFKKKRNNSMNIPPQTPNIPSGMPPNIPPSMPKSPGVK